MVLESVEGGVDEGLAIIIGDKDAIESIFGRTIEACLTVRSEVFTTIGTGLFVSGFDFCATILTEEGVVLCAA